MLLSYTDGQDLMHKVSAVLGRLQQNMHICKSNHHVHWTTHREYIAKAEHMPVACSIVSVRNAGCLSLKASVEVWKCEK